MATTLANLTHKNVQADQMLSILDVKRPNVAALKTAEGEKDVEKSKRMIEEICDYLGI